MAPPPILRTNEPLERGQTTILGTLNGGLGIQRPPLTPRAGPAPKASGQSNTVLGRRLIGGTNERQVLELFVTVRLAQDDGVSEPGDVDLTNSRFPELDKEDEDFEY